MSASGSTTAWFFAPPRACTRLPASAARWWTYLAMGVEPTKLTAAMPGWSRMASTATLSPCTTLKTPSGRPASAYSRAMKFDADGSRSLGLRMKVFPAAIAMGCIHIGTMTGKLNGVIPAQTPSGWRNDQASTSVETCSENSPLSRVGIPQAYSTTSRPRMTSPLASETTLPCSSATITASSSRCRSMRSRRANMTRARRITDTSRHSCHALAAAATAASTSAGSANATWACCSPVAGFQTGPHRLDAPVVSEPAIQCWIVRIRNFSLSSQVHPLVALGCLVGRAGLPRAVQRGGLRHRHVPPALRGRHRGERVGLDVGHRGAVRGPGLRQRGLEVLDRPGPNHVGAEAGRVGGQVDREDVAVQQPGGRVAVAVAGAEPLRAERLGQRADRAEALVLHQDDVQLDVFGDRGHDLLRHHQVGPVADEHEDLAVRGGHLGPQAAGDLVAHARVAVLDVVLLRVPGPPQHLQVAGHAAGRLHDHVPLVHELVERAEDLGLGRQRLVAQVVRVLHHLPPVRVRAVDPGGVLRVDVVAGQLLGQRLEPGPGVGDERGARLLARVEGGDVEVDEPHVRVGEGGARGGGEVA